jgi:hypothetical protein
MCAVKARERKDTLRGDGILQRHDPMLEETEKTTYLDNAVANNNLETLCFNPPLSSCNIASTISAVESSSKGSPSGFRNRHAKIYIAESSVLLCVLDAQPGHPREWLTLMTAFSRFSASAPYSSCRSASSSSLLRHGVTTNPVCVSMTIRVSKESRDPTRQSSRRPVSSAARFDSIRYTGYERNEIRTRESALHQTRKHLGSILIPLSIRTVRCSCISCGSTHTSPSSRPSTTHQTLKQANVAPSVNCKVFRGVALHRRPE